ncbi:hypothetical protein CC86DRAFT_261825, partial [Ophiobolus disseminans]
QTSTLKIRIPKSAWNAYERPAEPTLSKRTRPKLTLKLSSSNERPPGTSQHLLDAHPQEQNTISPPAHSTNCKATLWRFQPGGPIRSRKEKLRTVVTNEAPCLRPTYASCWKWHPHLMCDEGLQGEILQQDTRSVSQDDKDPISSNIDPRLLDGTWQ